MILRGGIKSREREGGKKREFGFIGCLMFHTIKKFLEPFTSFRKDVTLIFAFDILC